MLRAKPSIFLASLFPTVCFVYWVLANDTLRTPRKEATVQSCKLPVLNPWDKSILPYVTKAQVPICPQSQPLTYLKNQWLRVNSTVLKETFNKKISSCKYQAVKRSKGSDKNISVGKAIRFHQNKAVKVKDEFIKVSCYSNSLVYRNYHAQVLEKQYRNSENTEKKVWKSGPWSVLLIGTDTFSHSAAVRYVPKTRRFLLDTVGGTEMLGYNRVGDNTFPNLVSLLTGHHVKELGKDLDLLPLVFKNFSEAGYRTLFGEDSAKMDTFNYLRRGFKTPPADYYFRPLSIAASGDTHLSYKGCEGHLLRQRLFVDYLKQFVKLNHQPFMGLMFFAALSHDNFSDARWLDQIYVDLLKDLYHQGIFNNTIVIFFSDHGFRFGKILGTQVGKIEANLPWMSIALPAAFLKAHPHVLHNLQVNSGRLTTHFDVHQTLLQILDENQPDRGLHGTSLFSEIDKDRNCSTAAVPTKYYICHSFTQVNVTQPEVKAAALFLVGEINQVLHEVRSLCEILKLKAIKTASRYRAHRDKAPYLYKVVFTTLPGSAHFEGAVSVTNRGLPEGVSKLAHGTWSFVRDGLISRVNRYDNQSICVSESLLRLYCYCKHQSTN